MNNWKVIFATAVIFGAGVITGGLLVNYVQHSKFKPAKRFQVSATNTVLNQVFQPQASTNISAAKPQRPADILSKDFLQRLTVELHLSEAQREAVQKIINEGQSLIRKTIQDARLEIRDVLTLEQRAQFDELVKRPVRRPATATNTVPGAVFSTNSLPTSSPAK